MVGWELGVKPHPSSSKHLQWGLWGRWGGAASPQSSASPPSLPLTAASSIPQAPVLEDIDKEQLGDPYANAQYAKDIFDYMREREVGDACWGGLCGVGGGLFWGVGVSVSP